MIIKQGDNEIGIGTNLIRFARLCKNNNTSKPLGSVDTLHTWQVIIHYSMDDTLVLYFDNELEARELFEYLDDKTDRGIITQLD